MYTEATETRMKYPRIHNVWRSILYTEKGRRAGCSEEWRDFLTFFRDVFPTYEKGKLFRRKDPTKPFSKENFEWLTEEEAYDKRRSVKITYDGKTLSFRDWSVLIDRSEHGIRKRYYSDKNLSTEEILFGVRSKRNTKVPKHDPDGRAKASKMISSYRIKDRKAGLQECDITTDWMLENITHKPCTYCGDTKRVGCDRIDNNVGHLMSNVIPCCYECNCARNRNFTHEEMIIIGKAIKEVKAKRNENNLV